jgi:ABC-2 type transport system permease protein
VLRPPAWRAVATIAADELRRLARDRFALVFTLALPVLIIVLIGSTFGAAADDLEVGVLDQDGTAASEELVAALRDAGGLTVEVFDDPDDLRFDVRSNGVASGIVVPAGYGDGLAAGGPVTVDLLVDPTSTTSAAVRATVEAAVSGEAARLAAATFASEQTGARLAFPLAQADVVGPTLGTVPVRAEDVGTGGEAAAGDFGYTTPANLVLFVFVSTLVVGAQLANDRRAGLIRRMLATPHRTRTILLGIGAAKLAHALVQSGVIVVVGAVAFGVDWGDPLGAALTVLLFALVATGVGLLVGAAATDAEQARSIGSPVAIALGMLGGCMWPLEIVPPFMRTVGHVTPHAWAMDAWTGLIFDGAGVAGIAVPLLVLAGFAATLLALASWRLRRTLTR